jgi:Protein of unknown function (DUF2550)
MSVIDLIAVVLLALALIALALIIARQRHMLHSAGGIPLAARRGNRWLYGVGRYDGDELQWYRAIGVGTRPTRVLRRTNLHVLSRRAPAPQELGSLPTSAVIVELRDPTGDITIALADGAFTGFVSWLEASATQF